MKKNLLSILVLFLLILPITACDEEFVNVNTVLQKQPVASGEVDFNLNDCAEIRGGGRHTNGDEVTITVRFVASACKFGKLIIGDSQQAISALTPRNVEDTNGLLKEVTYTFSATKDTTITAVMIGKGADLLNNGVHYQGVFVENEKNGTLQEVNNYAFPLTNANGVAPITATETLVYEIKQKTQLKVLLSRNAAQGSVIDPNYIYKDPNSSDNVSEYTEFVPYQLNWELGDYVEGDDGTGKCTYANKTTITNPSNYELPADKNTCLRAIYHTYNSAENEIFKNNAINKMLESKVNVSVGSQSVCGEAALPAIGENCFYVENLKNLYNSGITSSSSEEAKESAQSKYYGYNDDNMQEAIVTVKENGKTYKYYYICTIGFCNSNSVDNVSGDVVYTDAAKIVYPDDSYLLLSSDVKNLINAINKDADKNTHEILFSDITFAYNRSLQGPVPVSIKISDTVTYYVQYNSQGYNNIPTDMINAKRQKQYTFEFAEYTENEDLNNALLSLKNILDSKATNRMFTDGEAEGVSKEILSKFATLIDANKDSLSKLQDYAFKITIEASNVKVDVEAVDISGIVDALNFMTKANEVCVYTETSSCDIFGEDKDYIYSLMQQLKLESNIFEGYQNAIISKNNNVINYELFDVSNSIRINVIVDLDLKEVIVIKDGQEYKLYALEVTNDIDNTSVSSINYYIDTILGRIAQELTINDQNEQLIKTTLDGHELSGITFADDQIKTAYQAFTAGAIYYISDEIGYVLVYNGEVYSVTIDGEHYDITYGGFTYHITL